MHAKLPELLTDIIANERTRRAHLTRVALKTAVEGIPAGHGRRVTVTNQVYADELISRSRRWSAIARRLLAKTRAPWTREHADLIYSILEQELAKDLAEISEIPTGAAAAGETRRVHQLEEALTYAAARIRAEHELLVLGQETARIPLEDQLRAPRYAAVRTLGPARCRYSMKKNGMISSPPSSKQ